MTPELLLAEDNAEDVRCLIEVMSQTVPVESILVTHNSSDTLDFFFGRNRFAGRDLRQQPRLTLLDMSLPQHGGLEVLRQLRDNPMTHRLPIVLLSATADPADVRAAAAYGANSFLRKPMARTGLEDLARHVMDYWLDINIPPPPPPNREQI